MRVEICKQMKSQFAVVILTDVSGVGTSVEYLEIFQTRVLGRIGLDLGNVESLKIASLTALYTRRQELTERLCNATM